MSLAQRLWIYQAERFPLLRTVPLRAVFPAAGINVSALPAGLETPGIEAYLAGLALALILFFRMREADEWTDREIDARYRPERPVPRELVSLRLVLGIAVLVLRPTSSACRGRRRTCSSGGGLQRADRDTAG